MSRANHVDNKRTIDDFVHIIHDKAEANTSFCEARELEKLIKSMWNLLTPIQSARFTSSQEVKSLLTQDNAPAVTGGYQGSMGGFGTEELEEWQRMVHWPTP
jgi:hypothetical protein